MTSPSHPLQPDDLALIAEEQALLDQALLAIERAQRAQPPALLDGLRDVDALRALQREAAQARTEDLAPLMHELSVRQQLIQRVQQTPVPDLAQPYFAHLRLREGTTERDYLLGSASLLDGPVRIVDWRVAPVAQLFYRYREGDEYEEEFPGRTAEGTVVARRVVVLEGGCLVRILGDDRVLWRDAQGQWQKQAPDALAVGGAGTAFRPGELGVGAGAGSQTPVTALLDAQQFSAIQAPPERPLLVLGSAGSGKTTVALHRLATLATRWPQRFALTRTQVVVPSEGLARLSRRLLAPLGLTEPRVQTLDAWAIGLARRTFPELPRLHHDAPALVISLKRHPAFFDALRARLPSLTPEQVTLPRLRRRLHEALTDRAFLTRVVAASRATLPLGAIEETIRHTMQQLADDPERELRSITDRERRRTLDGKGLTEDTPEALAQTLDVEDLPILLSLRAQAVALPASPVTHLVLDEAEDFSLFELDVLRHELDDPPSVTLAGDEAQQTTASFAGWERALAALGLPEADRCRLTVSYRCPRPIAQLARHVLGPLAPPEPIRAARDGVPVRLEAFSHEAQAQLFLAGALADLLRREPRASVGVLAHDVLAARRLHALLAPHVAARLVQQGEFGFEPGVDVTDLESAKGLEFDYVVVPDATADVFPERDDARRALHVAVTRASHQLLLLAPGPRSPLLPPALSA